MTIGDSSVDYVIIKIILGRLKEPRHRLKITRLKVSSTAKSNLQSVRIQRVNFFGAICIC